MKPSLYDDMSSLESRHFWFRARREIIDRCLERSLPSRLRRVMLDAGCGTGANFKILERHGEVVGIDSFRDACLYAASKHPGRIARGRLESLPLRESSIDVAVLLDVLEHVNDQQAVLGEILRVLRAGGTLLVTVPAFRHLWSGHDVVHQHLRRYRTDVLRAELVRAGFEPLYISYFNTHLYCFVALSRLIKKIIKPTNESDMRPPAAWLNEICYYIFKIEKVWIYRIGMPLGVSLIALVRKPNI